MKQQDFKKIIWNGNGKNKGWLRTKRWKERHKISQKKAHLKKCKTNFRRLKGKKDVGAPPEISLANGLLYQDQASSPK